MKLLILTQKVDINDGVLGFMHGWIAEFAKHCESVIVVCLYKGEYDLPANVKVLSLGKELRIKNYDLRIKNFFYRFFYLFHFYKYIWYERKNYDKVFVHMNPEYVVFGGLLWRAWGKRVSLWYVHKAVNLKLRLAEKLTDIIFTASAESFGLRSKKVEVMGHGIDLKQFLTKQPGLARKGDKFKIVYVGRISPIKNQELLMRAVHILVNEKNTTNIEVNFIGGAVYPSDKEYLSRLKNLARELKLEDKVIFAGSIPNREIAAVYKASDLSVNLCPTGGMDKAVLESWASGLPCLVFNKTFAKTLSGFPELLLEKDSAEILADKIKIIMEMDEGRKIVIGDFLRKEVTGKHSLQNLVPRVIGLMRKGEKI